MLRSLFSKPYSHLYIVGDNADWVIDQESKSLIKTARALGIKATKIRRALLNLPQAVHYSSQFSLNEPSIYKSRHRISVDYFHGKPEQGENFKKCFESLKANHEKISMVRVSTKEMEGLIKSSGIDPKKVQLIPIGVDTQAFTPTTIEKRHQAREKLDIPLDATVIGSFQKDGVGWAEGNEPKLIKGPDIFLKVIKKLKVEVPNLFVLLSGPARGYVKNDLENMGVPYQHKYLKDAAKITELYDALDLYLISSREEGGPKACLESMAQGIPLVTTKVGQCKDLAINGLNAMMADIDDIEGLTSAALKVFNESSLQSTLIKGGLNTAEENNFENQLPLWREYLDGLLNNRP